MSVFFETQDEDYSLVKKGDWDQVVNVNRLSDYVVPVRRPTPTTFHQIRYKIHFQQLPANKVPDQI